MRPLSTRVALALLLVATMLGCQPSSDRSASIVPLAPDPRAPRDERFLTWGTSVTIADVPRAVLSASKFVQPPPDITNDGAQRRIGVPIPAEFKDAGWIILEAIATRDAATTSIRNWPVPRTQAGHTFSSAVLDERIPPGGTPGVRLYPVPDLATRDVDTPEVTVPAHAVLQAGMGLEPVSWDSTVIPVDMTVSVVAGGNATVLHTTRIDVHKPEQRQWVDLEVPLDDLAGKTVRFRFAARPSVGPSAVPSLPVWAEPVVIDKNLIGTP